MDEGQFLESWKEISAFLGRDIRTCQRWERELGLPIHRLDGSPRARVFAYKSELGAWLDQKLRNGEPAPSGHPMTGPRSVLRPRPLLLAISVLVLAALIAWRFVLPPRPPRLPAGFVPPVLAVVPFENKSGEIVLEYWRDALPELLIADLSQSIYLRVVTGGQMLATLRRLGLDQAVAFSSEDLEKIAAQTQATQVISGSYLKAGEAIVITAGLQETGSARAPGVIKLVARNGYDVIAHVDQLARRVKKALQLTRSQIAYDFAKEAGQAVTSSPEALKYYVEGRSQQLGNRWEEAVASMEKAIALDPGFAMAYRTLATAQRDLGHYAQARSAMATALAHGDRLSDGERRFIEGQLAYWDEDYPRVIEVMNGLLRAHPGHLNAHTYLGYAYADTGDIDRAIEHQSLVTQSRPTVVDVRALAAYLQRKGRYQEAADACLAFLRDVEEAWPVRQMLAYCYAYLRKPDLAVAAARKAYQDNARAQGYLGEILVFADDLAGAETLVGPEPYCLNRGRFAANIEYARSGLARASAGGTLDDQTAAARRVAIALEKAGRFAEAYQAHLEYLRLVSAAQAGPGLPLPSCRKKDLFFAARVLAVMGRTDQALRTAEDLKTLIDSGLNPKEMRFYEYILGLAALTQGDATRAAGLLGSACARLDPEDFFSTGQGLFLSAYAGALRESGDPSRARAIYEKITLLTTGRSEDGDLYALAHYWLGRIADNLGEKEKARNYLQEFLALWQGADPGLPEVADAAARLSRR